MPLPGKGISVAAPAGGAYSMYTDWVQDGSKKWETFLSTELPNWLAANKGLAPGGHGVVGVSQGGYAPRPSPPFIPTDSATPDRCQDSLLADWRGRGDQERPPQGGADSGAMWGAPQLGRWKWPSPNQNLQQLVDNNARLWIYSPGSGAPTDQGAMAGYGDISQGTNATFYSHFRDVGGTNGHFDLGHGRQRLAHLGTPVGRNVR